VNDAQLIQWNQQHAYEGKLGGSRESYCRDFVTAKAGLVATILADQINEAEENGTEISCRKGCRHSTCCMEHIESSLQECEAIVYYLYNHPDALAGFVENYQGWREKLLLTPGPFQELEALYADLFDSRSKEVKSFGALAAFDKQYFDLHVQYFDLHLHCPFLLDDECLIYDARPYACVGAYSTAPLDLCAPRTNMLPPITRSFPPDEVLNSIFFFQEISNPRPLFMPLHVYEILVKGYEHLARVSGISDLVHEAKVQKLIFTG
jgi:Fe-S-cluster containining protein